MTRADMDGWSLSHHIELPRAVHVELLEGLTALLQILFAHLVHADKHRQAKLILGYIR
jgi:hypothetical protein